MVRPHDVPSRQDARSDLLGVEFLHKLRDEEKYSDLATLTRQIALDVKNARAFFNGQSARATKNASAKF